jgi:hypothetical protein
MIWVNSTAAKLVAAPLAAQAGADLLARPAESGRFSNRRNARHTEPDGFTLLPPSGRLSDAVTAFGDAVRRRRGHRRFGHRVQENPVPCAIAWNVSAGTCCHAAGAM